jgi:hypothetical protein
MAERSGSGRRRRHGTGLWQGAAVVVAAATLMASSQVDDPGRPAASTAQDPAPAGVETLTHPAGDSTATPDSAPGTTASPAPPPSPSSPSSSSSSAAAAASGLAAGGIPSVARAP